MNKFIPYVLEDPESDELQWVFIIEANITDKDWDGRMYTFEFDKVVNIWEYIGEYPAEQFYAEKKDLNNTRAEAQRQLITELI